MNTKAFFKMSYGLYVVSSMDGEKYNGQIANAVVHVTAEPAQFMVGLNKKNLTSEYINKSKKFSISVLSEETPLQFIGLFGFKSGRDLNKFESINFKAGISDVPIVLDNTLSYFECEVMQSIDVGSHILYIGKVVEAEVVAEGEPMTYAYYHKIKGGKTEKNAPTYQEEKSEGGNKMDKYRCTVCGYIYDPEKGDPDSGIAPGTKFEDIPDDWVCPVCGVDKSSFEKV